METLLSRATRVSGTVPRTDRAATAPGPRADPAASAPAPRVDLYRFIHKALRAAMMDALRAVSSLDVLDPAERSGTVSRVRELVALCRTHLEKEEKFVHPAIEARAPGSIDAIVEDHRGHLASFERIEGLLLEIEDGDRAMRSAAADGLYAALAVFVAENFEHMHAEELHNNRVLWATHTDQELAAIEGAIVGSTGPGELAKVLGWMLPALNPSERSGFLGHVRAKMPPHVFDALLESVRPRVAERDWGRITAALA